MKNSVKYAMAKLEFKLEGMGGNTTAYVLRDETIGEVVVVSRKYEGYAPEAMSEPVCVYFSGMHHTEPLIGIRFRSVSEFLESVTSIR